jgi:hypothetical protein
MNIYLVENDNGLKTLVKAKTKAQAYRHVLKKTITVRPVKGVELVDLLQNGVNPETALKS